MERLIHIFHAIHSHDHNAAPLKLKTRLNAFYLKKSSYRKSS